MSADSGSVDRRRASRVPLHRHVRLRFGGSGGCEGSPEVVEAETSDISASGMFVVTSFFRRPGDHFEFEIRLSDEGEVIEGAGEVVRLRGGDGALGPSGMGVHFLELRGRGAERVTRLLELRHVADRSGLARRER